MDLAADLGEKNFGKWTELVVKKTLAF